jgi:hypothetical protein
MRLSAVFSRSDVGPAKSWLFVELPCQRPQARVARQAAQCFVDSINRKVPPNPSIERTCPGKPGHASHLKR